MRALLLAVLLLSKLAIYAQSSADSIWCEQLNEIIKCVSMDKITPTIGRESNDTSDIAAFKPKIKLTTTNQELLKRQYKKVSYEGIFYQSKVLDKLTLSQFEAVYQRIKKCLDLWEIARLPNQDPGLKGYQDYFITNSEDETTLRLDIVKQIGYVIRLRIY